MKRAVSTDQSPRPAGSYSQAIVTGSMVFVSGQGPTDPATERRPDGIEAQTHQTIRNIRSILEAADCTLDDVVKVTAHLADIDDFAGYDGVYRQYFREPLPVRTTVGSRLIHGLVEIDVIAVRPDRSAISGDGIAR